MPQLRGRAASPIRPGLVAKAVLAGEIPMRRTISDVGMYVTEAAICDLHATYSTLVGIENSLRPKAQRLRGMTYTSFLKLFKFAQLLGLVTLVREDPMELPPPGDRMFSVRVSVPGGPPEAVLSTRRIFKLSAVGKEDEKSWTNLCRAWIESWPAPQKAEYFPPYVPVEAPTVVVEPIPERVRKEWSPFRKTARYSAHQLGLLKTHLRKLQAEGLTGKVRTEVERLSVMIGDWSAEAEGDIIKARLGLKPKAVEFYKKLVGKLNAVELALLDENLEAALSLLEEV